MIPPISPLTFTVARRHANALSTKASQICMALRHRERNCATRSSIEANIYHMISPIIPLTSNTPRLRQHDSVLHSGAAHRKRTSHQFKAAQIRVELDITDVISPRGPPPTRSKHIARYHHSSRSPATRRVYTSMFRAPQWHGATQTHFPPRPRKSKWRCDITNVISPHGLPTH